MRAGAIIIFMDTLFQGATIQQLQVFLVAAKYRNFTRAAEELHMTVPAVSRNIAALEAAFGVALYVRSRQRVYLSPAGERFEKDLRPIMRRLTISVERARQIQDTSAAELRIGDSPITDTANYLIPTLINFEEMHPDVNVTVESGEFRMIADALIEGKFDAAITAEGVGLYFLRAGLCFEPVFHGRACLVISDRHPLFSEPDLVPEDLADDIVILMSEKIGEYEGFATGFFKKHHFSLEKCRYANTADTMDMQLRRGRTVALLSTVYATPARKDLRAIPVGDEPWADQFGIGIAYHPDNPNRYLKDFLAAARKAAGQ